MLQEQTIDLNSERLSLVGKALSSDIRIRILRLLGKEPLNVNEIADRLGIPEMCIRDRLRTVQCHLPLALPPPGWSVDFHKLRGGPFFGIPGPIWPP